MLFNSYEFIFLFLPITFFVYFYLNKRRLTVASRAFLVFASLFFYSYWNIIYLPLILSSMLFNYTVGHYLSKGNNLEKTASKKLLGFGIFANLALLGYFKYSDFFIKNFNFVFGSNVPLLHIALPLAISFFTFQQIAYLVDSYNNETKEYDFLNYALFIGFFPQLIAGPIVHHKEMMPQFANGKNKFINYKNITSGLFIFSIGLFKKVVVADQFAIWANAGFDSADVLNFFEAWATSLSYSFQLYFDFSGYCDMAIGGALLFNIKLPINFYSPYKSLNIQDFWRKWHITLGRFLHKYLYIPLGGNRCPKWKNYLNLMIVFVLGGIWHGAGWGFIIWGALHGVASAIFRFYRDIATKFNITMPKIIAWFITFNFVNLTWIFFRANSLEDALKVLKGMIGLNGIALPHYFERFSMLKNLGFDFIYWLQNINGDYNTYLWIVFGFVIALFCKNSIELTNQKFSYKNAFFAAFVFAFAVLNLNKVSVFLYFNF
ncbi:MBOAT family O-acyltransferase [uncultured Campylobacter sp.]|uniref:MBOAT family O-acyltransferase n=1 Tax=uncultured Campylobacter sp. TaxID=218934 RepID=UPI00261C7BB0|nr:MBOAT family O-acyltransferase [uncultured Campylobacter sp.]